MNEANEIDEIREAFEAAWLSGTRPDVADFASRVSESKKRELLEVLIPLDVRYRQQRGERVDLNDYVSLGSGAVELARGELQATAPISKPPRFVVLEETVVSNGSGSGREEQSEPRQPELTDGRVQYFGEYELLSEIARGGMGVVYKARQSKLNRIVALKMILSGELAGDRELKRFQAEAEAAAKLDHRGLVPIFEIGEHEGRHFIAMAYIEGRSLATKLRDEGPMRPKDAAQLVRKITDAIHYAHSKGVIHRDLKPGNILLDTNDEPRVTDFGLAKQVNTDSELTSTGQVLGTPSYMPPEQAAGRQRDIGAASDVYSIGAILYACLTGRPPFQGASATDVILQVLRDPPPAPRTLNRKVDRDLNTIVMKCLDKPIGGRYPKAINLRVDLDHYLRGQPILARPVGVIGRTFRWAVHNKAMSVVLAALLVSLAYPLAIGVKDLFRHRSVISQLASAARGASDGMATGYVKRMQMINSEGEVETAFATVVPGIRSMRLEEVEELVEAACDEAIVLRLVSGSDSMTHYRTGARVEIAVELEKNGEVQTLFSADWDMRAAVDAPVAKIGTLTFLRHERQEDGSEHWDFKQTLQQKRVTKSETDETHSKSLLAEFDAVFQSNSSQSSSSGYSYGRGVDVWSEPVTMTLDQRLERIESLVGLSDEERKVFTEEFVSGLSFGSSHSGSTGNHTEVGKEITLYESSGGSLLHLNYLRKKHKLPEKPETPDAIVRVTCRMLPDEGEAGDSPSKTPTQEAPEKGVLGTTTKARSYFDRGYASYGAKKYAAAVKDLSQAIENRVKMQDSHHFCAHCYLALGEYEPALSDIRWLTRYVPNKSHYHDMMSKAFHGLGQDEEARRVALKSIELQEAAFEKNATESNKSDLASSLNALAWTLATYPRDSIRDGAEAVKLATRACELTQWSKWHYLDTLAAAYAEAGDFPLAVEWLGKTIEALPESEKSQSLDELESRLRLFKSGEAYRDGESVE